MKPVVVIGFVLAVALIVVALFVLITSTEPDDPNCSGIAVEDVTEEQRVELVEHHGFRGIAGDGEERLYSPSCRAAVGV